MLAFCFKRSAVAVLISGLLLLGILVIGFFYLGPVFTLLLFLLMELIAGRWIHAIILQEFSALSRPLFQDCNPQPYILSHEKLLRRISRRNKMYNAAKSNLSVGYYSSGQTEKGISLCRELLGDSRLERDRNLRPVVYMNLCTMLLALGKAQEAQEIFTEAYTLILSTPENTPLGRRLRNQINLLELRRRVLGEHAGNCQESLLSCLNRAGSPYERVQIQYLLFRCYQNAGQEEPMLESLRYVAEKGRHLAIAQQACRILESFSSASNQI